MEEQNTNYPLILVFYLNKELMMNPQIIQPFVETVNRQLEAKKGNVLAYFLPTDGVERVECINPIQVEKTDMEKINKMVEDIKKQFDIGQGADKDLKLTEDDIEIKKECACEENGMCTCNNN